MMNKFEFPNNKPSRLRRQKRRDKRLSEEIIECRRYAGGDTNKKVRQKGDTKRKQKMEEAGFYPSRESVNFKNTTSFEDNLEPLERFLRSNVGRPWSAVYAELSRQLDRTTTSGQHVIDHLFGYVDNQWNSLFPESNRYRTQNDGVSTRFSIHPETGILCILNPRVQIPKGPFPKKSRFKKEKQSRKAKVRLGLEQKSRPQKQIPTPEMWFCQLVDRHLKGPNGANWDDLLHRNASFREGNTHIILILHTVEWIAYPQPRWKNKDHTVPANKIRGAIWIKPSPHQKPQHIIFESVWDASYSRTLNWTIA